MKDSLLKDLKDNHVRLMKAIKNMPEDLKIDKWSKKEIAAHITGWYEEGIDALPKILSGEKPNSFRYSINGFNKRNLEKRKDGNLEKIYKEAELLHTTLVNLIKKLEEKQITSFNGTVPGKKPINPLWIINETISHDSSHAKEIEELIK